MEKQQAVLGIDIAKKTFAVALSLPEQEHWKQQDYSYTAAATQPATLAGRHGSHRQLDGYHFRGGLYSILH